MYLTKRQRQMLECIEKFITENGYSPTLEEIGSLMGLSSPATVHKHLQNLESKGQVKRLHHHSRALELTAAASPVARGRVVKMLGYVAAGAPIEAIETPEKIDLPSQFNSSKETFVLCVRGDSMIEDGIHDGDQIIIEKKETADTGQTVVALVDDESATVKRYYPERGGKIRLQPANSAMKPMIYPAASVQIQGVVIGLIRKYDR